MKFTIIFMIILSIGCSFKNQDKNKIKKSETTQQEEIKPEDLAKLDSDGDRINDLVEKEKGLNAFVADIPNLRVRFLQNYSIKIEGHENQNEENKWNYSIDTKVASVDPDFKYRVGEILARNKAYAEASRVGRFSTHTVGEILETDLTRVIYPDVDARFTGLNTLNLEKYLNNPNYPVSNVTVELENSIKLEMSSVYSSVKNLELNFYYFNHETEGYELLATKLIEQHFNRDITEIITVKIENVPLSLIKEGYLKRGEFIVSEVKDFEIPELGIKYSELISSVKAKTIQIITTSPLETKSAFVAPSKNKNRFSDLMDHLYPKQFKIEEDLLLKVGQFENNLADFTHLREVKDEDKKGKWFVFTNRMSETYLDHEYQPQESIVLSYITGKELAEQTSEKLNSLRVEATGGKNFNVYPLGNISPNSVVDIHLSTGLRKGEKVEKHEDKPVSGGGCGSNCRVWQYQCHFKFNVFKPRNEKFEFKKNLSLELSQLSIIINEDEFNLKTLVDEKKVDVYWVERNVHFRIRDISKIKEIYEAHENAISLKITTLSETTHEGVFLVSFSGRESYGCLNLTAAAAFTNKWPIYEGSKDFDKWKHLFDWKVHKVGKDRTYKQPFSINMSSSINNYYN